MSGDYSRERFDPRMHLSGLLQQQGRVHYDGDANELMRILARRSRAQTADAVGRVAVPRETPDGFRIQIAGGTLTIGRGRLYVDGLLAENHGKAPLEFDRMLEEARGVGGIVYAEQPYLPNAATVAPAPADGGPHLVYLVVYEREATYLQLPQLIESAIGQDTVTALQTVWQVRVLPNVGAGVTCATPDDQIPGWNDLVRPSAGRLSTKVVAVPDDIEACVLPATGGYRGLENQLYRIEIHDGGAPGTATFKWSRDNGTVATNVTAISGAELTVVRTGRDGVLRFNVNDTVEITSDDLEFAGKPGEIRRVKTVSDTRNIIELDAALPAGFTEADGSVNPARHTRIRRWDSDGLVAVPAAGTAVTIERGVQAVFNVEPAGGSLNTFDYWTFAARTADASIEILDNAPPRGIHRHYCRLAVVTFPGTALDCRTFWPPLPAAGPGEAAAVTRIRRVDTEADRLLNDASVRVGTFAAGVKISCETSIDPESVVGKPTCFVTLELPFPFNRADLDVWGEPLVGFAPIVLNAQVAVQENVITWTPERDTAEWLVGRLFQRMREFRRGDRVLAHLTLKGNFIWARERREDRLVYLDGDAFGTPRDHRTDLILPSGDGARGGDFRMWLWLIPDAA